MTTDWEAPNGMKKEEEQELMRILGQKGRPEEALKSLHRAVLTYMGPEASLVVLEKAKLSSVPPEVLSYYGLCVALVENRVQEGMTLCKMAIEKDMLRHDFYRNLGKVYLKAGQKPKALQTFRKGLELTDKNSDLARELKKHGERRKPALSFLPRSNFVNRYIGLMMVRFSKAAQ
jgi:tetratricopeptide (TPR) repeat protein